jgi:hypothetical protein
MAPGRGCAAITVEMGNSGQIMSDMPVTDDTVPLHLFSALAGGSGKLRKEGSK